MAIIPDAITFSGINVFFWSIVSLLRAVKEKIKPESRNSYSEILINNLKKNSTAVLITAINEDKVIKKTISTMKKIVGAQNIYVMSDGSTDNTHTIIKKSGVQVIERKKSRGKAKSLITLMKYFRILDKYPYAFIVDADITVNSDFLDKALKIFADPDVAAVTGHAEINWKKRNSINIESFILAYRQRLYSVLQYAIRYGQTWKLFNATPVIPGFATIFRTSVLKKIDLSPGGLIIEDFNTAFQIHKKKLGKVYYHPEIWAYGNEPSTINDYIAQVNRWNLGFWQTLFKHKIWASFFSLATVSFVIESLFIALFLYMLPLTAFVLIIKYFPDMFSASLLSISESLNKFITPALLFTAVIFLDFIYTVIVAIIIRKPVLLFYGPGFIFFRFLDSLIILSSLFQAIFTKSDGVWTSPKRKRL